MTVSSTSNRKTYAGNGVTTSFATSPVVFVDSSELFVYDVVTATGVGTLLTENTHYAVTGGAGLTGIVDTSAGSSPQGAIASGHTLVIIRSVPLTQEDDFVNNDASDAEVTESALDKLTFIAQQLQANLDRAALLAESDVSGADLTLPTPVASQLLGWDSNALALVNYAISTLSPGSVLTTAFTATLLDDASANAFVQTLVAALTAETAPATDDVFLIGDTSEGLGNKMTFSNTWKVINAFTADASPDRTADYVATYDASAAGPKKLLLDDFPFMRMAIAGFTYSNNVADATNDIDIAVGSCRDSTNAANIVLNSALTKRLDANWAVGTNQGGILSGAAANVDYNIWAIKRPDTGVVDIGLETTASVTPTLPANYTQYRLIGWFKRVGGTIVAFHTYELEGGGIEQLWDVPTLDVNLANTLTTTRRTDAVKVPLLFSVLAKLNVRLFDATTSQEAWIYNPDHTDAAPSGTVAPLANVESSSTAAVAGASFDLEVRTSATGTIAARTTLATVDQYSIVTLSFKWARKN